MPVPKKRHSNTRTRTRRANWKLKALNLSECPQCHAAVMSHMACPSCGTYQGRQVIKMATPEQAAKEKAKS